MKEPHIHHFKLKKIIREDWNRSYGPSELTNFGYKEIAILYCSICLHEITINPIFSINSNNNCEHDFNLICSLEDYEYYHYARNDRSFSGYCSASDKSNYSDIYACKKCGDIVKNMQYFI